MDIFTILIIIIAVFLIPTIIKSVGGLIFNFIKLAIVVGGLLYAYTTYIQV